MNNSELIANRALEIRREGHFDAESIEPVPSPCISVCRMSPDRSHCEGCFRTLDEIRIWARADGNLRRSIWQLLLERAGIPPISASAQEPSS